MIASRRHAGRPIEEADYRIATIPRSHGAVLVTRNVRDFEASFPESRQTGHLQHPSMLTVARPDPR